jgi:hypothetical protein
VWIAATAEEAVEACLADAGAEAGEAGELAARAVWTSPPLAEEGWAWRTAGQTWRLLEAPLPPDASLEAQRGAIERQLRGPRYGV